MQDLIRINAAGVLRIPVEDLPLDASFIELGGNSLSAISLINACRQDGVLLDMESVLTSSSLSKLSKSLTPEKILEEPIKPLLNVQKGVKSLEEIPPKCAQTVPTASIPTLSASIPHMQLSFIQGGQQLPGANVIHYYETYAAHNLTTMKRAWRAVIESEPIFRTDFNLHDGNGVMTEKNVSPFNWTEVVVNNDSDFEMEVREMRQTSEMETSFKAVILLMPSPRTSLCTIIWHVHHALIDGHSCNIILAKVREAMDGLPIHPGLSFLPLANRLQDYQQIQREKGQQFWREQHRKYDNGNGILLLPQVAPGISIEATPPMDITVSIPQDRLLRFAQSTGVTLASLYYAAWTMVLSRYIGSDTVTCGVIFSCRDLPLDGITETVGSMVNTLPLHITIDRKQSTLNYVRHVFRRLVELSSFQWTIPEDGYTRDFSSVLGVQFEEPLFPSKSGSIPTLEKPYSRVRTDIPLNICVNGDGTVIFSFCETYSKVDIERMVDMFQIALSSLLGPSQILETYLQSLLSETRLQELLSLGNCFSPSTTDAAVSDDLATLFERSASQFPTAVAIKKGPQLLTYEELNNAAKSVADYLLLTIEPGTVVCVHADRSVNWIIAIYGILKANAVYCPLDSTLPADLRSSYLQDAGSHIFLTTAKDQKTLLSVSTSLTISVEEILELDISDLVGRRNKRRKTTIQILKPSPHGNAYLCFTSGSSGKPKGVMCTHKGLVAFQSDLEVRLFAQPGRKIAQLMSPAFDGSIHEIFSALSYGATLVLGSSTNPFGHLNEVDSAILTPSIAAVLNPSEYKQLQNVYLVGEVVSQKVNDCWAAEKELYNMYGPTEATCGATIKRLQVNKTVTIGIPNSSTRIYILDGAQNLLPRGVAGEICLAGVQVSRGYIGRPQETAKSFMPDTICKEKGGLMYRTGDRGFWNNDGEIVCIGRKDRQMKVRGYRLDLNDLETRVLRAVPLATAVAIANKEDILVGMLQPASLIISDIRSLIARAFPPYAVPQQLAVVEKLPTTTAGKIDYTAIANFTFPTSLSRITRAVLSNNEKLIACAWRSILNIPAETMLHQESNFLDLGGNSIKMLLLSHRLANEFKREIPPSLILRTNTLSELADEIERLCPILKEVKKIQRPLGDHELSPIEHEWWSRYQLTQDTSSFNVSFACSLADNIARWKLTNAWNAVLARHSILKCRYIGVMEGSVRREYAANPPHLQRIRTLDMNQQINLPFRLHAQHPIRVLMTKTKLLVVASHIICDLTTMRLLLGEVAALYHDKGLGLATKSYSTTDSWNIQPSTSTLKFWSEYLSSPPRLVSSIGNFKHQKSMYNGTSRVCRVPTTTFETMSKFIAMSRLSFHQLTLAAVSLSLTYDSEKHDIILGAPYLNRVCEEEMETVGLFLQPLPIRIFYPDVKKSTAAMRFESPAIDPFLLAVRTLSRSALSHPIQWHQLLTHLGIAPGYPDHPLFDVMVTFHELESKHMLPIPGVTPLYTWTRGAKFKLMIEAQVVSKKTMLIRFEYDEACFSEEEIQLLQSILMLALDGFSCELGFGDVKARLQQCAKSARSTALEPEANNLFDKPLESC